MSLFQYLFDNEWFQRADINRLDEQASRIHSDLWSQTRETRDLAGQNEALRQEVSRLVLVVEALNRLALEKNLWSADDLARTMGAVDMEDGIEDGRRSDAGRPEKLHCAGCGREIPRAVARCPHCNRPRTA